MSGYIGTQPVPQATQTRDSFTCTAGQTSFATSGYTPNFLDVYLNGVKLTATDYTASNGSDVVLTSGAATGDVLEVVAFTTFDVVTDTITAAGTALTLDRTGSNGTILDLKKDGSTVGSVGAFSSSNFGITGSAPNKGGLVFATSEVLPAKNGTYSSSTVDLGNAGTLFKDLYLSGGVYLGGTGSANKLDDYEEGTWEIVLTPVSSGSITLGTNNTGAYTKVGRAVTVTGRVDVTSVSSPSGRLDFSLPFSVATGSKEEFRTNANVTFYRPASSQAAINFEGRVAAGESVISIYLGTPTNGIPSNAAEYVQAGSEIWVNCTYFTA